MADTLITVTLDDATAEAYQAASEEERAKMHLLVRLLLREYATSTTMPLPQLMDLISDEAIHRGLTPELLEQILDAEH